MTIVVDAEAGKNLNLHPQIVITIQQLLALLMQLLQPKLNLRRLRKFKKTQTSGFIITAKVVVGPKSNRNR